MLEGLRAEFPALGHVPARRPSVSREGFPWAVVSGIGAGFLVNGIAVLWLRPIFPLLFPETEPRPEWLTMAGIGEVIASLAIGAVLMRVGGVVAFAAYGVFELLRLLASLPGRELFCERSGGLRDPFGGQGATVVLNCQNLYPQIIGEHWPVWAGLAAGALLGRQLVAAGRAGANRMLRGAGVFALIVTLAGTALGLASGGAGTLDQQLTYSNLFAISEILAGAAAGAILARAPLAALVLVGLLVVAPTLSYALPLALQPSPAAESAEYTLLRWSGVYIPLLAATGLAVARLYVRRRTVARSNS